MQKKMVSAVQVKLPEEECRLEYYLCIAPGTYGMEITKKKSDTDEILESKALPDVCCSFDCIMYMIRKLANNTVTPMSLTEVMEALLLETEDFH